MKLRGDGARATDSPEEHSGTAQSLPGFWGTRNHPGGSVASIYACRRTSSGDAAVAPEQFINGDGVDGGPPQHNGRLAGRLSANRLSSEHR